MIPRLSTPAALAGPLMATTVAPPVAAVVWEGVFHEVLPSRAP